MSQGGGVEEKMLKQRRSRNGCTGNWRKESALEPQRRIIVPWIKEWIVKRSDNKRKA
jgi:hypothetical protein